MPSFRSHIVLVNSMIRRELQISHNLLSEPIMFFDDLPEPIMLIMMMMYEILPSNENKFKILGT